jgi:hypothetical protein
MHSHAIRSMLLTAILVMAILAVVTVPETALAACRWTWDCSGGYPCRQVPLCEGPFDIPPVQPPSISPIPPPSIRPIPTPMVPPVGTDSCEPRYLCTAGGRCQWRTVCR